MVPVRCGLAAVAIAIAGAWAGPAHPQDDLVGAALRHRPSYDGSGEFEVDAVPLLRLSRGAGFARTTHGLLEGGARFTVAPGLQAGVQGAHEAGPRDEQPGLSVGLHVEWNTRLGPAPATLLARARRRLRDAGGGALDARVAAGIYQAGRLRVGAFVQGSWADADYRQADYGVREAGLLSAGFGAAVAYDVSASLLAVGGVELRRLAGALAGSEHVDQRSGAYVNVGLAYRF